jgi:hypothetical protein
MAPIHPSSGRLLRSFNLDVLNVWDRVPDIVEMFHLILEALIGLLLDRLQGFSR